MQNYIRGALLTLVLLFISTANFWGNNSPEQTQNSSPKKTYAAKIDSFLTVHQNTYGKAMKDSTWKHLNMFEKELIDVQFDNFEFVTVTGDSFNLGSFNKPLVIIVSATWCGPCKAAIPAIDHLVETYKGEVQFLYLMHDLKPKSLKFASYVNSAIPVIASNEKIDPMQPVKAKIGNFEHVLQFPTTYFLDKDRMIRRVMTGGPMTYLEVVDGDTIRHITKQRVFEANLITYKRGIKQILQD